MFRRCLFLSYKQTVAPSLDRSPKEDRYWGLLGSSEMTQLTTYNTGSNHEDAPVVESVLAAAALDEENNKLIMAIEKNTQTEGNLLAGGMSSLVFGSANPQIHNFFKQLQARCWTATITGSCHKTDGATANVNWDLYFKQNSFLLRNVSRKNQNATLGQGPAFSSSSTEEDEPEDFIHKNVLSDYTLFTLDHQNGFLGRPDRGLDKINVITIPELDPIRRSVQKWMGRMNLRRDILIEGIKTAYSVNLRNAFVFHLDKRGFYIMGLPLDDVDPSWQEYFLEWGPGMECHTPEMILNWWIEFVGQTNLTHDEHFVSTPEEILR